MPPVDLPASKRGPASLLDPGGGPARETIQKLFR